MTSSNFSPRPSRRVRFPGGSGFELAGIIDSGTRADGDPLLSHAPTVVFSHCFTCNKDLKAIVRISRALAASGVTVLRFDMTGLGGSEGDFSQTNFTTNVADLRAAIRFAAAELGPVTGLVGHSFGGAASLAVGGDPQDAGRSLKAIATIAAPADTQHLADLLVWMNPQIHLVGSGEVEIGGRRWTIRQDMINDFRHHRLGDLIAKIAVPLTILHSSTDETVSFDQALRIYQLASLRPAGISPPAVSLLALDGADHLLANRPSDLAYTAEILSAFFRRHAS